MQNVSENEFRSIHGMVHFLLVVFFFGVAEFFFLELWSKSMVTFK